MNLSTLIFKEISKRAWLLLLFIPLIIVLTSLWNINYIIDPFEYRTHKSDYISIGKAKKNWYGNIGVYKLTKLENNQYDTLIIGSSRVGTLSPDILKKYGFQNPYNFYIPQLQASDALEYLKYIIKTQNKLKTILYGVEFAGFNRHAKSNIHINNRLSTLINLNALWLYRGLQNFSKHTLEASLESYAVNNLHKKPFTNLKIANSDGHIEYVRRQKQDLEGKYNFQKENAFYLRNFKSHDAYYKDYVFSTKEMEAFREIIRLCKKQNIHLKVFFTPIHHTLYEAINKYHIQEEFIYLKKKVSEVTDYVDFTSISNITKQDKYFWDAAHYKKSLSPLIYDKLFLNKGDFGQYVPKSK